MRMVAWPSSWKEDEGLLPVEVQEIDLMGTPEEIRSISMFLAEAARLLEADADGKQFECGMDLGDSKSDAKTGIHINVVRRAV